LKTAFLDISQAFDKVWHAGLLYKLRLSLPLDYFFILKSYLRSRHFLVKVETQYTELSSVNADVPQGNVLGLLLYLLYTADLPTSPESSTATFANDTAVVATDSDPAIASQKLQTDLLAIQDRFKKWRMKTNEYKSIHVTFTTRTPRSIYTVCSSPKQKMSSILGYTWTGDLPGINTFSQNGNN
jgi:hypothetical protein